MRHACQSVGLMSPKPIGGVGGKPVGAGLVPVTSDLKIYFPQV